MDSTAEFIKEAILDIQTTIRAIDTKIAALLTTLIVPFTFLGRIWSHLSYICTLEQKTLGVALFFSFFIVWALSIFSLARGLSAIDNPANHIVNSSKHKGLFYGGGLFEFSLIDSFINRKVIKASKDVKSHLADLPSSQDEINEELAFEQMKLIYIRDIKIYRFKTGFNLACIWLTLGVSIFLISKLSL